MIIAYILIVTGVLFFLKNAGIVSWSWGVVWPILLVGLGIYGVWTSRRISGWFCKAWEKISKKLD